MSFNAKQAAERLFAVADMIEKQASQKTFFVCEACNHTASMESINSVRSKFASENGIAQEHVSSITIDDVISCKACGGDMKYAATEESEKFFVEEDTGSTEVAPEVVPKEDPAAEVVPEEVPEEDPVADEGTTEVVLKGDLEDATEETPKKNTPKDKKDSDGKVVIKEEPAVQFGDEKTKSKTAFDKAVDRYLNF